MQFLTLKDVQNTKSLKRFEPLASVSYRCCTFNLQGPKSNALMYKNTNVWTATCISMYSLKQFWKVLLKSIHSKCFLGKNCVYVPGMEQLLCGRWTPTSLVPPLVCHIHGHSRLRPRLGGPPAL